jgi:hypothetical protein
MRRSFLGPDPLATVTFAGVALVATAALLGSAEIDGSGPGFVDVLVALTPLTAVAGYLLWVHRDDGDAEPVDRLAVSILASQADDPTVRGDDPVSRAAADLITAVTETEREEARRRLLQALDTNG